MKDLLIEAKEFVKYVAKKSKSGEPIFKTAEYIPPAWRLRRQADAMEQRDMLIEHARVLVRKIEETLRVDK